MTERSGDLTVRTMETATAADDSTGRTVQQFSPMHLL